MRHLTNLLLLSLLVTPFMAKSTSITGRVKDLEGQAIADAQLVFYQGAYVNFPYDIGVKQIEVGKSDAEGAFTLVVQSEGEAYHFGTLLAHKPGHAWGWVSWNKNENELKDVALGRPADLWGLVVDKNGAPIAGAEVAIAFGLLDAEQKREDRQAFNDRIGTWAFQANTDGSGQFRFRDLPATGRFELLVSKPGYATVASFDWSAFDYESVQFQPGQEDIKIVLPPPASISGTAVDIQSGEPLANIPLMLMQDRSHPAWGQSVVRTGERGEFSLPNLTAGAYTLQLVTSENELADWVAEPVKIELGPGQIHSDARIELSKGGLLEVLVTEAPSKKPIAKANVNVRSQKTKQGFHDLTNQQGMAQIRLWPGAYEFSGAYKEGYDTDNERRPQQIAIIEGQTVRMTKSLKIQPQASGRTCDDKGTPLAGVELQVVPGGSRSALVSKSDGTFEVTWQKGMWGGRGNDEPVFYLVARHVGTNRALAEPIDETVRDRDFILKDGIDIQGYVVNANGKGISDARIRIMLQASNWGASLRRGTTETDSEGLFVFRGMPVDNRYSVNAVADGYGEMDIDVQTTDLEATQLDLESITLPAATMSITGRVVDEQGDPVVNAQVESSGEGQADVDTKTDAEGHFTLDGICAGQVFLRIDARQADTSLRGYAVTWAGARNITLAVRAGRPVTRTIQVKTREEILMSGKRYIAGTVVDEQGTPVANVPLNVCCHRTEREKGKYRWSFSSFRGLGDVTDSQGRFAIELEKDGAYNLRFSPPRHAAVIAYDVPVGTQDLKVTLPQGGNLTGRLVRMQQGKKMPIPHATLKLEQTSRASFSHLGFDRDREILTDAQGRFRFDRIRTKIRSNHRESIYEQRSWELSYTDEYKESILFTGSNEITDFEFIIKPQLDKAPSLIGQTLPSFDGLDINRDQDTLKSKRVLICFFDMQQRPARRSVVQMAKRYQELTARGVTLLAIQSVPMDHDELQAWVKQQKIPFPIGHISGDADEVRYQWSVKALPWLILTDKNHAVIAEGFGVDELNRKVKEMENDN